MTKRSSLRKGVREAVFNRDGNICLCCLSKYCFLEVDHIIEVCNGGTNDMDNLQTLCSECNRAKEQLRKKRLRCVSKV